MSKLDACRLIWLLTIICISAVYFNLPPKGAIDQGDDCAIVTPPGERCGYGR
jgi:hypothetical protein